MLSSVSMWLFTVLLIVVAFTPDVIIRVGRKHWASIIVELRHIGRSFNKKMKKEAFLPQKTYYNPSFENRVVGRAIKPNTSMYC